MGNKKKRKIKVRKLDSYPRVKNHEYFLFEREYSDPLNEIDFKNYFESKLIIPLSEQPKTMEEVFGKVPNKGEMYVSLINMKSKYLQYYRDDFNRMMADFSAKHKEKLNFFDKSLENIEKTLS